MVKDYSSNKSKARAVTTPPTCSDVALNQPYFLCESEEHPVNLASASGFTKYIAVAVECVWGGVCICRALYHIYIYIRKVCMYTGGYATVVVGCVRHVLLVAPL